MRDKRYDHLYEDLRTTGANITVQEQSIMTSSILSQLFQIAIQPLNVLPPCQTKMIQHSQKIGYSFRRVSKDSKHFHIWRVGPAYRRLIDVSMLSMHLSPSVLFWLLGQLLRLIGAPLCMASIPRFLSQWLPRWLGLHCNCILQCCYKLDSLWSQLFSLYIINKPTLFH